MTIKSNKDENHQKLNQKNQVQRNNNQGKSNTKNTNQNNQNSQNPNIKSKNQFFDKIRVEEEKKLKNLDKDQITYKNNEIMDRINGKTTSNSLFYSNDIDSTYLTTTPKPQSHQPFEAPDIIDNIEDWLPDMSSNNGEEKDKDKDRGKQGTAICDGDGDDQEEGDKGNFNVFGVRRKEEKGIQDEFTFVNDNFDLLDDEEIFTSKINIAEGFKISNNEFKENMAQTKNKDSKSKTQMTNYLINDKKGANVNLLHNDTVIQEQANHENGYSNVSKNNSNGYNNSRYQVNNKHGNSRSEPSNVNNISAKEQDNVDYLVLLNQTKEYSNQLLEKGEINKIIKMQSRIKNIQNKINEQMDDQ